jgi:exosortase/archaeosortase family protein
VNLSRPAGTRPAGPFSSDLNVTRAGLFACLGVLAALNAEAGQIISQLADQPLLAILRGLAGVSAVIWFAIFACLKIGFEDDENAISKSDWAFAATVVVLCLIPVFAAAKFGLLLCALYLLRDSSGAGPGRRVGAVLLALTGTLIWGPFILDALAGPLLSFDAHVVGGLIGTSVDGNLVQFAGVPRRFLIGTPCSSVHNISLALVLWTAAAALFRVRFDRKYLALGIGMAFFMFLLNIARLSSIGLFPDSFSFLHDGVGAELFGWAGILGVGVMAFIGVESAVRRQR